MRRIAGALRAALLEGIGLLVDDIVVLASAVVGLPLAWVLVHEKLVTPSWLGGAALFGVVWLGILLSTQRAARAKRGP